MHPRSVHFAAVPAACALACAAAWAQSASAPAPSSPNSAAASAACERAARNTLNTTRGAAADVSFQAPPVIAPGPADASEIVLRGAGRARSSAGTRSFSYSCSFDTRSGEVAGVVLRDAQGAEATAAAAHSVEPDLSNVSPLACESAAATALKRRWPAVSRIAFNGRTRTMQQDSLGNAALQGQGTAQPAPDAPSTHFTYTCAVDPRNGRVLATHIAN